MVKIAFIWSFPKARTIVNEWRDGLRRAIEIISETHEVDWYLGNEYEDKDFSHYDALLFWNDSNDPVIDYFERFKIKKGLILTTMPQDIERLRKYNIIFCESKPVLQEVKLHKVRSVQAFGTDTDFFTPDDTVKDIPYFYPATFSPWKRQRDIAHYSSGLTCIGTLQPDGQEDLQACLNKKVHVEIGYFPVEKIRDYYRRARNVVIPAVHGSERTVLEAMSMDLFPMVNITNVKAYSYVLELMNSLYESPRDFVVKKYNAHKYAEKILEGLRL